jgi:hypothetical protein
MKYSKWLGVAGCLALIGACFMPWTYHADLGKTFTGFFSQNNTYGTPGKYISIFAGISAVLFLIPKLWAKRIQLLVSAILMAYTVKSYILYTSCYNAYCPEKRAGIFLIVGLSIALLIVSFFPDIKIKNTDKKN